MQTYGNEWKRLLREGKFLVAGHIFLPNPAMAEAMANFGYRFVWVDAEHGAFDREEVLAHITALNGAGAGAFVRVAMADPMLIKPVLEMGPDGIIAPNILNPDEAAAFVSACRYPPKGTRGFGPRRANRYGMVGDPEYLESIDEALVKIIQIEHIDAVKHMDAILDVEGIDSVVIGPYDLSGSMGLLGKLDHPDLRAACAEVVAACKKRGIPCGASIGPGNDEFIRFWLAQKVNFLFCGDDLSFVKMGTESTLARFTEVDRT